MNGEFSAGTPMRQKIDLLAAQYDELPYVSKPFAATHPARLAAIAHLFGLEAPPLESARVLELGCASGGNLIPHAVFYPEARFLGIDISQRQVEDGQVRIARLGLSNIELRHMSLTDINEDFGTFDYIVSHGVFSWVPEPVREALLRVCRKNLTPNGIVYVSFNVLPGWRMQQPLNDACKELIPPDLPLATRSRMARELFEFFKAESLNTGAYGDVLRGAPERVANHTDDQLFHEYLEDTNCPMFFSDFALEAHRNGLAYLGDADLEWMFPDRMRPGFGKTIRERMAGDRLSVELMVDFLTGRSFRRSLLVASEQSDRMAKQVTIDKIANLHFHVAGDFNVHFGKDKVEFKDKHGRIRLSGEADFAPLVKLLVEKFPASVTLAECQAGLPAKHSKAVAEALFGMTISGILIATSTHLPAGKPGNRPRASLLARSDAAAGLDVTVNRRHEVVRIDAVGKVLIPALDGNTSHDDLVALVCDASAAGTLVLQKDGIVETDQSRLREAVPDMVVNFIKGYAQTGLLEA